VTSNAPAFPDASDDIAIVRRVRRGDTDAFRLLVTRYEAQVFRLLRALVRDEPAVEELAQDVFLAAFTGLPSFDPTRGRFSSWLLCIAKHRALNAKKQSRAMLVDELPITATNVTPADDLVCTRLKRQLDQSLRDLPEEQQTAFLLAEILGLSPEHIAEIECASHSTIRSRLSRAKAALLSAIAKCEDEP
jgi:RNA polymerase sigma-70 factor, ECF subfamily